MAILEKQYITLQWYQGETFTFRGVWKDNTGVPIDLTGWQIRMQVRKNYDDAAPVVDLDNATKGGIVISDVGTFVCTVSADDTSDIEIETSNSGTNPPKEIWRFDVEAEDPYGVVIRIIQGEINAWAEVTK